MIIAASGHRPDKLGGYGVEVRARLVDLAMTYLLQVGPVDEAISGMALGWDTAWAIAALKLRIPVHAAIPFAGQHLNWPRRSQDLYRAILGQCSQITYVGSAGYSCDKMQDRNRWMADRAGRIAALWNGSPGGTRNCLRYARARGVPIDNLWQSWQDRSQ